MTQFSEHSLALHRFNFLMRTRGSSIESAQGQLAFFCFILLYFALKLFNIELFTMPIWSWVLVYALIFAFIYFKCWDSDTIIAFEDDVKNESEIQMANKFLISILLAPIVFMCFKLLVT